MKPTVINSSSEPSHPVQHEPTQQHPNKDSTTNDGQNPANNDHSRRFPQFRQHGFGFNDPDDDVFANMGLRSRLNRMGNPFDWSTRKRQNGNDPYQHYFRDDVDFPHFGSTWDAFNRMGNKRSQHPSEVNDRSGFFDYLPPEFRQYMPENFDQFDSRRQPAQHPGHHQHAPQQHHEPSNAQQSNSKTNLCDASIQTDDLTSNQHTESNGNAAQNENKPSPNQSNDGYNRSSASSSSTSTPYGDQVHMSTSAEGPGAHASASARNNQNQYCQQSPQYENPYGRQYQEHPYAQSEQQSNQHPPPQQSTPITQGVRNVPIFFEGSSKPVNRSNENVPQAFAQAASAATNKPRPEPLHKQSFSSNEPIPVPAPPNSTLQTDHQHSDQVDSGNADAPPQTPHTADCISKIQAIQRDVLDLMCAVEQFGGKRGGKEYMYLDEMLTRNLLKLDTIDTNGKESIRLARREAIKCVQASIAVLEAKSDLYLNEAKDENNSATLKECNDEPATNPETVETKLLTEVIDETEVTNADELKPSDESAEIKGVENITIDDNTNAKESQPIQEAKPESEAKLDNTE